MEQCTWFYNLSSRCCILHGNKEKKKGYGIYEIGCLFLVKVVHQ